MPKYWVLSDEFGASFGEVTEGVKNPEGSKQVNNIKQADRALDAALKDIEEAFNKFIEESEKEEQQPEKPGRRIGKPNS